MAEYLAGPIGGTGLPGSRFPSPSPVLSRIRGQEGGMPQYAADQKAQEVAEAAAESGGMSPTEAGRD